MVLVMLLDDSLQELVAEGVAGSSTEGVPKGFRFAKDLGIPGEVLETGVSRVLHHAPRGPDGADSLDPDGQC